ncbi:MAG: hypothetical protein K6G43_04655 [Lachnospiraceae bacterium]|nr:hypothetical protein [Lachnospiraceae bacterium]
MKRKFLNQIIAVGATVAMVASLAGCGGQTGEDAPEVTDPGTQTADPGTQTADPVADPVEESPYEIITDADGNPIDLGGMEVVIRDWWSSGEVAAPTNDYEEARQDYRDWAMETYNFTIKEVAISDWGTTPQDFVDYVTTGGDDNNYVFTLRTDPATSSALAQGLMYDLATLDCLDFDHNPIFTRNQIDEVWSNGDSIYCMHGNDAGYPEVRQGLFFNKRVLEDAGIDPESIYDMQANGTWTWDAWIALMDQVQRDIDNDGTIDVYGMTENYGDVVRSMILSNGGQIVALEDDGKYRLALEDANTQEALTKVQELIDTYDAHVSYASDAQWDYYMTDFMSGNVAFTCGQGYMADGQYKDMEDDFGFVSFPVGPSAGSNYKSYGSDNLYAIPACYDADKAWKIAFAYATYMAEVPGYEDYQGWTSRWYAAMRDTRAVDETCYRILDTTTYDVAEQVPQLDEGSQFLWNIYVGSDMAAAVEGAKTAWTTYIDDANASR